MTKRKAGPKEAASSSADFEAQIADIERKLIDEPTESDENLAAEFLLNKEIEKDGVRSFSYLTPGSKREVECRAALLRLLRGSADLSNALRWRLASLLDPDSGDDRALVIRKRTKGGVNEPSHSRAIEVARVMADVLNANGNHESAIKAAMQQFGISRSSAERAFRDHIGPWIIKPDKSAMS
jgi:hypothetical protein